VDIPRRHGEAVSYAVSGGSVWKFLRWLQEGQRFQEWSKNEDQKRWEPGHAPVSVRYLPFTFFVSEILDGLEREGS